MKAFLVALGVVVLGAALAAGYFFWSRPVADITLEFSLVPPVLVGQPFKLEVGFTNGSERPVSNGRLAFALPPGISFLGKSQDLRILEIPVGDLGPGSLNKQTVDLVAVADPQSVKRIEAKLTYASASNGRAQIETRAGLDISIGQPAVNLAFKVPQKVFSGSGLEIEVTYENNSEYAFDKTNLKIEYPPIFQFQKSSIAPSKSNSSWTLGSLPRGGRGSFTIMGSVIGPEESAFRFLGTLTADFGGQQYVLNTQEVNLAISTAPVSVAIEVNRTRDYVARADGSLDYVITYRNNSATTLDNLTISAAFSGEMFDFAKAKSDGAFNSITNTFFWNTANTPALASLPPGGSGSVKVSVDTRAVFPIRRLSDKNYVLKVRAQIESPTVPEATGAVKTISVSSLETKVAGAVTIKSRGYFRDAASGILNVGPYPPVVNQPTQYTIHWIIANYSTDISGVRVSAFLQGNTKFTGKVKSTIGTSPKYDPTSGEVSWEIANLPATKGVLGGPVEAIFQIENVPAINEIGDEVTFMSETRIVANDNFTNLKLTGSAKEISSELPDDPTVADLKHNVQL